MPPVVELALQVLPQDLSPVDIVPPAIVVALVAVGNLILKWRGQSGSFRQKADDSTWSRMVAANEILVAQRDDGLRQVEQRDERIRQLAEHIADLERGNQQLREDLREALRQIRHEREEPE